MLVNYHVHSACSFDAEYPLREHCAAALSRGIGELCLTDHCDLLDEYGAPQDIWDWEAEDRELLEAREAFPEMTLRRGLELGEAVFRPEAAEKILAEPGIDFVLGSVHNSHSGTDFYWTKYDTRADCLGAIEAYLQDVLALTRTDWFDSLAHLTYPLRYMRGRDGWDVDFHPFEEPVREILNDLIVRGKALELNTSGMGNGGDPMPSEWILRLYRDMGGELITLGSDAHEPKNIDCGLRAGVELLKACGFRYLTCYQNRKPQQILLK